MPTQNLLRLLLLLMLMLRNVLKTVWCRFWSWSLFIKLHFCSDFDHKVWSKFWSWRSGKILKLNFSQYFAAGVWLRYEVESWSRFWNKAWSRFWGLSLVLMFGWYLNSCARFWRSNLIKICFRSCDMTSRSYFGEQNSTLGSVVPLAMFHNLVREAKKWLKRSKVWYPYLIIVTDATDGVSVNFFWPV